MGFPNKSPILALGKVDLLICFNIFITDFIYIFWTIQLEFEKNNAGELIVTNWNSKL